MYIRVRERAAAAAFAIAPTQHTAHYAMPATLPGTMHNMCQNSNQAKRGAITYVIAWSRTRRHDDIVKELAVELPLLCGQEQGGNGTHHEWRMGAHWHQYTRFIRLSRSMRRVQVLTGANTPLPSFDFLTQI